MLSLNKYHFFFNCRLYTLLRNTASCTNMALAEFCDKYYAEKCTTCKPDDEFHCCHYAIRRSITTLCSMCSSRTRLASEEKKAADYYIQSETCQYRYHSSLNFQIQNSNVKVKYRTTAIRCENWQLIPQNNTNKQMGWLVKIYQHFTLHFYG